MAASTKFDKDKFESAMRIAEFSIRQFNERRDYSWKISLGFWGGNHWKCCGYERIYSINP